MLRAHHSRWRKLWLGFVGKQITYLCKTTLSENLSEVRQVNVSKSVVSFMMPCPYRNHQNSLKSSQFYLLHVFYSVQFSGNWRVKPKRKAAATTKSLGTIKANTMADTAISLVAELVPPSCHLHWQCVIVNFSTITVFPVGSNTIWNDNYTSTKTSLLQQEKKINHSEVRAAFIFVSDNCF